MNASAGASVSASAKAQIHQAIDRLPPDQLVRLWEFLQTLGLEKPSATPPVAPLYHVHEQAISTGVSDLAERHDHYLYGQDNAHA